MSRKAEDNTKVSRGEYPQSGPLEQLQVDVEYEAPHKWANIYKKVCFKAQNSVMPMATYVTNNCSGKQCVDI